MASIPIKDEDLSVRIRRLYPRLFLIVFIPLFALLNISNRELFFKVPAYEEGDNAANVLQIHRAKSGSELYGNYSRFSFNHPGPGFFYAYALAEVVLYDQLKIVPMPRNAHLWMTLMMQCGFFAAALALAAAATRNPAVVIGLSMVIGAWHFGRIGGAFFDNWPPHVLLMPFLCLIVSAAVVSLGRGEGLLTFVLSACFLVHGHIAQPLFVIPISVTAITCLLQQRRLERAPLINKRDWAALSISAVFLLPLLIDLFYGRSSNFYRILMHLSHHSDHGQSFTQSLLCFLSYFAYCDDQSVFNKVTSASFDVFSQREGFFAAWLAISAISLGSAWWFRRRDAESRTVWRLALFYVLGVVLTLVWGMRQDGGFTPFNSYFNFGLIFVVVIMLAMQADRFLATWRRPLVTFVASASALAAAWIFIHPQIEPDSIGREISRNLPTLLHADPIPESAKLLEFGFVDGDWYETVTLARALQRLGRQFYVDPWWIVMFGKEQLFENQGHLLEKNQVSRWRIAKRERFPDALPLTQEFGIVFPKAPALSPLPATISFLDNGSHNPFVFFGIYRETEDGLGAWTEAKVAALEFYSTPQEHDVLVELEASGFGIHKRPQRAIFIVNGTNIAEWQFHQLSTCTARIPSHVWNLHDPVRIVFDLPDARSPARLRGADDRRLLGLSLRRLSFTPIEDAALNDSKSK